MAPLGRRAGIAAAALVACAAIPSAWAGPPAGGGAASDSGVPGSSAVAVAIAGPSGSAAARRAPRVEHMVAFRGSRVAVRKVRAPAATVRVGKRKRCAIAAATPLAALVRARPGKVVLSDYGSCSRKRVRDAGGLFVRSIRGQRNRGLDGWVYKVGRRLGTAGVADPTGPFGSGRLRAGQRVLWFYCVYTDGSCQRTLETRVEDQGDGTALVRVVGYDDGGKGIAVEGARVTAGAASAITAADGRASLRLPAGLHVVYASKAGSIRSFGERVAVR